MRVFAATALVAAALAGCASPRWDGRTIVGGAATGNPDTAYRDNLSALVAADRVARIDTATGYSSLNPPQNQPAGETLAARDALTGEAERLQAGPSAAEHGGQSPKSFDGAWRVARQTLYLAPADTADSPGDYYLSGLQARRLELVLHALDKAAFRLTLACDGEVSFDGVARRELTISRAKGEKPPLVSIGPEVRLCVADVDFNGSGAKRRYRLLREEAARPDIAAFEGAYEVCSPPPEAAMSPLQGAFWRARWMSQTCPFPPRAIALLRDEKAAFDAKVEALLGRPLPAGFIDRGDPGAPLDFSSAPKLSLVYVSYLDIKADFSGAVIDRLLRFHAARGTPVRVLATDVLEHAKDRLLLERLAADYPNVEVRLFAWKPPKGAGPKRRIEALHRVQHVKMLAAVSATPGRSRAVTGGRNIHDGFLFREPVDLAAYPDLNQYARNGGMTLNYYSNWSDFDVAFAEDATVRRLAAHLSSYWQGDQDTKVIRPFSVQAAASTSAKKTGVARHFISVPYADGKALEDYYVDLFDAARDRVEMINPYINPTPRIAAAIDRALARGVTIDVVGRIDMHGDLAGKFLTEMNEQFVERFGDRIRIREYKEPKVLLHAKILMIDGEFTLVSSVNLNHRSFLHDTENGVAVLDRDFYGRVKRVFDYYAGASREVAEPDIPFLWRSILSIPMLREAL